MVQVAARRQKFALPWLPLALTAVAGAVLVASFKRAAIRRDQTPDMAPDHTKRDAPADGAVLMGQTLTINRTTPEVVSVWRDIANLPLVLSHLQAAEDLGDGNWLLRFGRETEHTAQIHVSEDSNTEIVWQSTDASLVNLAGRFAFREAPGGRGTEVTATLAFTPRGGAVGRALTHMFTAAPELQGRREMKRLKMFMETGEIATARFHGADT